jgi:hypothetical protein
MHRRIYLLNKSHTRKVLVVKLEEAWFGRRSKVSWFKIFGLVADNVVLEEKHE